ncbi:MAG: metalloregulator ArsR/SmtB family transcription factor [Bacteroidota bacterium]
MTIPNLDAFQVIADPSRRQILQLLSVDRYNINSISENFEMSRPAVSKHIKILQTAGFISIEIEGRERYCILNQSGFNEITEWMNYYTNFWNNKLNKLESVLKNKR